VAYTDKNLTCNSCGSTFVFSTSEQEFFATKGYLNEPRRCPSCRQARQGERRGSTYGSGQQREMFPAVCAQCGQQTQVPFQPRGTKPVYCSSCYSAVRATSYR